MAYVTSPVYEERDHLTCVTGRGTTTKTKILVASIHSDPVTVTINGVDYVSGVDYTLTARGTPTVGYTGLLTITSGLSAYTRYAWTATDGTYTTVGSLFVEPSDTTSPFQWDFASCDNNTLLSNTLNANPWKVPGGWQYVKTRAQAASPPHAGVLFVDDLGYVDSVEIDDTGYSGLVSTATPSDGTDANDYLIGWFCLLGLTGPTVAEFEAIESPTTNDLYRMWAREENRAWCRKNLNMWVQWGDHEIKNDPAWDEQATGNAWTNGKAAWEVFYGLIQPDMADVITPLDSTSKHWAFKIGNVCIATLDGLSSVVSPAYPVVSAGNSAALTQLTSLYGNNQIDDVLTAINTLAPKHTILGLAHSIRYLTARTEAADPHTAFNGTVSETGSGAQHPIFDHCIADFQRLFTATNIGSIGGTPPASLMQNTKTNGTLGSLVVVHGDYHHSMVLECQHPAYTNNAAENWVSICHGTTNGSAYFTTTGIPTGTTVADCYIAYNETVTTNFHTTTFRTSDDGLWLHVRHGDRDDTANYEKKFRISSANYPFDESWEANVITGISMD